MLLTDYFLRKIAFATSVFGIIALFFFSHLISPKEVLIETISNDFVGHEVTVKGIVKNVFFTKNTLLFEVFDSAKIKAVKFSPTQEELQTIREPSFVEITGTIKKYKDSLEIVVKDVKKIG